MKKGVLFILLISLCILINIASLVISQSCDGCMNYNTCLSVGARAESVDGVSSYCDASHNLLPWKSLGQSCSNDYECASVVCANGVCSSCTGCLSYISCMLPGERLGGQLYGGTFQRSPFYCNTNNQIVLQKQAGEICSNNYECLTNECVNNACKSDINTTITAVELIESEQVREGLSYNQCKVLTGNDLFAHYPEFGETIKENIMGSANGYAGTYDMKFISADPAVKSLTISINDETKTLNLYDNALIAGLNVTFAAIISQGQNPNLYALCVFEPQATKLKATCAGCVKGNECLPVGTRTDNIEGTASYCNIYKTLYVQQGDNAPCSQHYECQSNVCINNSCVSQTFIQKVIAWFKNLFGM